MTRGNIVVWAVFTLMWVAFAAALVVSPESLDEVWRWVGDLSLIVKVIVWLLFLPLMLGLWIWESGWPELLRLVLVAGIAVANIVMFFPRRS